VRGAVVDAALLCQALLCRGRVEPCHTHRAVRGDVAVSLFGVLVVQCHSVSSGSFRPIVRRHKKVLEQTKGYVGAGNSQIRTAVNRLEKGLQYSYRDRRNKKREWKSLAIQRINAGVRREGGNYSWLMHGMKQSSIELNSKILADLAMNEPFSFKSLVETVKTVQPTPANGRAFFNLNTAAGKAE
jgi:large subunit ribosomal protein L20